MRLRIFGGDSRTNAIGLLAALCCILTSFSRVASAQTDYTQQIGAPVFSTIEPVELGFVNSANGNLHLEIPIASFPQRGLPPLTYKLVYDSRIWGIPGVGFGYQPNTYPNPYSSTNWTGWRVITSADHGTTGATTWSNSCINGGVHYVDQGQNQFWWQAPNGTRHYFSASLQFSANCSGQVQMCTGGSALDASGYYLVYNAGTSCGGPFPQGETILAPDGTAVVVPSGFGIKDRNGNYYSQDSNGNPIDTLGRTPVITSWNGTNSCPASKICFDVLNSQGGTTRSRWIVTPQAIPVHTGFGGSGDYSGNITVVQSITLPDGTAYNFSYDSGSTSGHFGEITGITLPTGGQISYGYSTYTDAEQNSYPNHWVSSHTSGGGTTSYVLGNVNTSAQTQSVTVTKPSGDYKVNSFAITNVVTYPPCTGSWKNQTASYSASGTLLSTLNNVWDTQTTCGRQTTETLTLPTPTGSISKQTKFTYSNLYSAAPTTVKEWNYYSGTPSANPDRITNITYASDPFNSPYMAGNKNILNLPTKIQVTDGNSNLLKETDYSYDSTAIGSMPNIVNHDDTNYGTSATVRGNLTQVQQWTGGSSYMTVQTMAYDQTGQRTSSTDANSNQTTFSYADCFLTGNPPATYAPPQATNAYLTQTNLPTSGNTKNCYYWNTGKAAWSKDQNSATASNFYVTYGSSSNDPLDRLITTTLPTGGWTLNVFSTPPTTVDTYTAITASSPTTSCTAAGSCRHDQIAMDRLGRTTDQELVNDPDGLTTTHTDYDTSSRVLDTSHPYRSTSDSTYGFETPSYDGLNRTTQIQHQDGNTSKMFYGASVSSAGGQSNQLCPSGTCHQPAFPTLIVDEAGKMRQTWTDAFGNVVEVDEPNRGAAIGSWGTATATYYQYDLLGNLLSATIKNPDNGECVRSYIYDTLSRVTSSTEPEPGTGSSCGTSHTTSYFYTASGGGLCSGSTTSLCRKQDARPVTTTYGYDALNRPTGMTYSDGTASVSYFYDQTSYNGLTITNGAGRRTGMSDGSGQAAWSFDANGNVLNERRVVTVVSPSVTQTISYGYHLDNSLSSLSYPSGRIVNFGVSNAQRTASVIDSNGTQYALAPSSGWQYAPTGALSSAVLGKSASFAGVTETRGYNNRLQLTSLQDTSSAGTTQSRTYTYSSPNNGEIVAIPTAVDSARSQNFTYDALSRILTGYSTANTGALDCWGQQYTIDNVGNLTNITLTKCSGGTLNASVNQNNQLVGFSYDNSGNLLSDGTYTYAYNGENEITSANGVSYTYDGNRMRIKKSSGTLYWRDIRGMVIAETNLSGTNVNEYVFFAGRRLARIDSSGGVYYYEADHLGTNRVIVNSSGSKCYDADFTPYGSEITHTNTCAQNYKFTGYERDSETGLDYAVNRYYNSRLGRFMNPDPTGMAGASLKSPQSLNGYAYVLNNPLADVDPSGLECVWDDGSYDAEDDPTYAGPNSCQADGGTWIELGQDGNWSANGNSILEQDVKLLQAGYFDTIAVTGLDGSVNVTHYASPVDGQTRADWTDVGGMLTGYHYNENSVISSFSSLIGYDSGNHIGQYVRNMLISENFPQNMSDMQLWDISRHIDYSAMHMFGDPKDYLKSAPCQGAQALSASAFALTLPASLGPSASLEYPEWSGPLFKGIGGAGILANWTVCK